jgi:catechol 2,3-dioxygenase-like lactoylglutathione lyase family enzyme
VLALLLAVALSTAAERPAETRPVDLVTLGVPDLDAALDRMEARTGVRPAYGGVHPTRATHNAVLALGDGAYLEILAARPGLQTAENAPLRDLKKPTVLWWGVRVADVAAARRDLEAAGLPTTAPAAGSRISPDGATLRWETFNLVHAPDGAPFFIAWAAGVPHPAATAPTGCRLRTLSVAAERRETLAGLLRQVAVDSRVQTETQPGARLTLQCGERTVTLPDDLQDR